MCKCKGVFLQRQNVLHFFIHNRIFLTFESKIFTLKQHNYEMKQNHPQKIPLTLYIYRQIENTKTSPNKPDTKKRHRIYPLKVFPAVNILSKTLIPSACDSGDEAVPYHRSAHACNPRNRCMSLRRTLLSRHPRTTGCGYKSCRETNGRG